MNTYIADNMFKIRRLYTHKRMMDCAIDVLAKNISDEGNYHLIISWVLKRGMRLNLTETVIVTKKELENWYEFKID